MITRTFSTGASVVTPSAVIFGDSITANGYIFPDGKFYPASGDQIGTVLGIQMENLATGGETTRHAFLGGNVPGDQLTLKYSNFEDKIAATSASLIYLRYGVAQAIKNVPLASFEDDLENMISIIQDADKVPIIVGLSGSGTGTFPGWIPGATPPPEALAEYAARVIQHNTAAQDIAAASNVRFVNIRSLPFTNADFLDGIHPDQPYSRRMVELIARSTRDLVG